MKLTETDIARILYETRWKAQYDTKPWDKLIDQEKRNAWVPRAKHFIRATRRIRELKMGVDHN